MEKTISLELRRRGVAASTMREALGEWFEAEKRRIIAQLAVCEPELTRLLQLKADATALHKLDKELQSAVSMGTDDE